MARLEGVLVLDSKPGCLHSHAWAAMRDFLEERLDHTRIFLRFKTDSSQISNTNTKRQAQLMEVKSCFRCLIEVLSRPMDGRRHCQEQGKIDATGTGRKLGDTDAEIRFPILHRWHTSCF